MTFAEYQSKVLEYYLAEQAAGRLFFASPYPTPAKIKTGCLRALETRYDRKDDFFLRSYFVTVNSLDLGAAVRKFETDKFRPLNSYLRDSGRKPSPEHIELLAWLVNYPHRPYKSSYELASEQTSNARPADTGTSSTNSEVDDLPNSDGKETTPAIVQGEEEKAGRIIGQTTDGIGKTINPINCGRQNRSFWARTGLYAFSTALLLSIGILFWNVHIGARRTQMGKIVPVLGQKGCVVWADDHYEPVSCKPSVSGLGSFGLDVHTVINLKKITSPDTITKQSIRRIWYAKIDGNLEYYTAAGFHPVHSERRLKPLTAYMYNKYLFHYSDKTKQRASFLDWFSN